MNVKDSCWKPINAFVSMSSFFISSVSLKGNFENMVFKSYCLKLWEEVYLWIFFFGGIEACLWVEVKIVIMN